MRSKMGEIMGKHESINEIKERLETLHTMHGDDAIEPIAHFIYNRETAWKKIILGLLRMTHTGSMGLSISMNTLREMEPHNLFVEPSLSSRYMIVRDGSLKDLSVFGDPL